MAKGTGANTAGPGAGRGGRGRAAAEAAAGPDTAAGPDIPDIMGAMGGGRFQPRAWNAGRQALEVAAAKESYNQVSNMRLRGLQAILRREGLRPLRSTRAAREEIMSSRHGDDWRSLVT